MKFGKRLDDDLTEVGWEEHYIRYRLQKKVIKVLSLIGKEADNTVVTEALSMFPRKKKILLELRDLSEVRCTACRRWRVFRAILLDDVDHVQTFLGTTLAALRKSYAQRILPEVRELMHEAQQLLRKHKMPSGRLAASREPTLYPGSRAVLTLARFATLQDTLAALRRFVVVNQQALSKITKKFRKRVILSVDPSAEGCGPTCARLLKCDADQGQIKAWDSSEDEGELLYSSGGGGCGGGGGGDAAVLMPDLEDVCCEEMAALDKLEAAAALLETKVMIECSTYHDFISDHKMQMAAQRSQDKLARMEARQKMLTRLTKHIDLETQVRPASFLLAGVVLPLVTLMITYSISATLYVDEIGEVTVFDEKGYFISASIDRAPAANIGTLGLTTTLSMLAVIIFVKHKIVKKQLRGRNWMRTHRIATAFGLMSTFCGNGVAAFQHQFHATAHNSFAATFFLFGMVHVVMETFIDVYHALSMPFTRMVRLAVSVLLVISVACFLAPMGYIIAHPELPKDRVRSWKKAAAAAEVAAFCCFVIWFASYYAILRASQFKLHVHHRVRLDSAEDLTALRVARSHRRVLSNESLGEEEEEWVAFQTRGLTTLERQESVGLDLDSLSVKQKTL